VVDNLLADFQALTTRLASEGPAGSVEFLLEQMEPESASHLRLCAIPHQFDAKILQALDPGLDTHRADLYCQEFSKLPVITFNHDGMALHDKARHHLFQQWIEPPISPAFQTASEHLVHYFDDCAKSSEESENALKLIRVSWVFHLIGADQQKGFDEFQKLCRQKRHQFALSDCEQLINLVHEYDSVLFPENAAWLTYHEGKLAADRCQWKEAEALFKQVLESNASDPHLQVMVNNRLGMIRDENRDYYGAIEYFQKALDLAKKIPAGNKIMARIVHDLGAAHRDNGDLEQAEKLLTESLRLAAEEADYSGLAVGCNSLGTLYRRQRETSKAIDAFQKSLTYLKNCGDTYRPAQVYNNLGITYRELGDWKKSWEFYDQSLKITRQVGDKMGQAKTQNNLITVYRNLDQNDQAVAAANAAIQLFEELHDTFNAALTKRNLGKLYRTMKNREAAVRVLTEAIEAFDKAGEVKEANNARRDLAAVTQKPRSPGFWIAVLALITLFFLVIYLLYKLA
jgi:tetratricopeptide (TPR) repeat protein